MRMPFLAPNINKSGSLSFSIAAGEFIVIVPPLMIFLLGQFTILQFGARFAGDPVIGVQTGVVIAEAWNTFLTSSAIFFSASFLMIIFAMSDFYRCLSRETIILLAVIIFSIVVLMGIVSEFVPYEYRPDAIDMLSRNLFKPALSTNASINIGNKYHIFRILNTSINVAALLVSLVLICGAISCIATDREGRVTRIKLVTSQIKRFKFYITCAAILMICGLVIMETWHSFAEAVIIKKNVGAYRSISRSITMMNGTLFTLMLLSYYIPIANRLTILIDEQVDEFIRDAVAQGKGQPSPSKITKWRKDMDLYVYDQEKYKQFAVLISPFLFGSIATIVKAFIPG